MTNDRERAMEAARRIVSDANAGRFYRLDDIVIVARALLAEAPAVRDAPLREELEHALRMPTNAEIMLAAGEFTTAQELRSAKAVLAWRLRVIRAALSETADPK